MSLLRVKEGPARNTEFRLRNDPVQIGRALSCQLRIAGERISRQHAKIEPADGGFVLTDLKSSNGTFVNGERVENRKLEHGDEITIGNVTFLFLPDGYRIASTPVFLLNVGCHLFETTAILIGHLCIPSRCNRCGEQSSSPHYTCGRHYDGYGDDGGTPYLTLRDKPVQEPGEPARTGMFPGSHLLLSQFPEQL